MRVGILALQGGVKEHALMVRECGHEPVLVKQLSDLTGLNALILPGGESTTMALLAKERGLLSGLKSFIAEGIPVFGTCAGTILLAKKSGKKTGLLAEMDIAVERNAYGGQLESFETDLKVNGFSKPIRGVFIRAPIITKIGLEVEVLASFKGNPVLVRQGRFLAATFHPELTDDLRIHKFFFTQPF